MNLGDIADVWSDEVIWDQDLNPGAPGRWPGGRKRGRSQPRIPLEEGDIVVTRIGGRVTRFHPDLPIDTLPRNFIVVRLKPEFEDRFDQGFVLAYVEQKIKDPTSTACPVGSVQQACRVSGLKKIPVLGNTPLEKQKQWGELRTAAIEQKRIQDRATALRNAQMEAVFRKIPDLRTKKQSRKSANRRIEGEDYIKVAAGSPRNRGAGMALAENIRRNNLKSRILTASDGSWSVFAGDTRQRRYYAKKRTLRPLGSKAKIHQLLKTKNPGGNR